MQFFSVTAQKLGQSAYSVDAVDDFCCEDLKYHSTQRCAEHSDPFACPDQVVLRLDAGTYGLPIHDGGSSSIGISRCPWCGAGLPTQD